MPEVLLVRKECGADSVEASRKVAPVVVVDASSVAPDGPEGVSRTDRVEASP